MGNRIRIPFRRAAILAVIVLLPGCIPWPVTMAMSGISYASTGKSIGDHFLSSVVQQDCSVGRAVLDQTEICQEPDAMAIVVEDFGDNQDLDILPASGDGQNDG